MRRSWLARWSSRASTTDLGYRPSWGASHRRGITSFNVVRPRVNANVGSAFSMAPGGVCLLLRVGPGVYFPGPFVYWSPSNSPWRPEMSSMTACFCGPTPETAPFFAAPTFLCRGHRLLVSLSRGLQRAPFLEGPLIGVAPSPPRSTCEPYDLAAAPVALPGFRGPYIRVVGRSMRQGGFPGSRDFPRGPIGN